MPDTPEDKTASAGSAGTQRRQWQKPELTEVSIREVTGENIATGGNDGSVGYYNS